MEVHEARGSSRQNFERHVEAQMWKFLVKLSRSIDGLHNAIPFVVISGQR